jgi:hypothetical protein
MNDKETTLIEVSACDDVESGRYYCVGELNENGATISVCMHSSNTRTCEKLYSDDGEVATQLIEGTQAQCNAANVIMDWNAARPQQEEP